MKKAKGPLGRSRGIGSQLCGACWPWFFDGSRSIDFDLKFGFVTVDYGRAPARDADFKDFKGVVTGTALDPEPLATLCVRVG